jgi:hypothetical protein
MPLLWTDREVQVAHMPEAMQSVRSGCSGRNPAYARAGKSRVFGLRSAGTMREGDWKAPFPLRDHRDVEHAMQKKPLKSTRTEVGSLLQKAPDSRDRRCLHRRAFPASCPAGSSNYFPTAPTKRSCRNSWNVAQGPPLQRLRRACVPGQSGSA